MLSGPDDVSTVAIHHTSQNKGSTHFAGLDRNRSRSVGFMEGKDTIELRAGRAIP